MPDFCPRVVSGDRDAQRLRALLAGQLFTQVQIVVRPDWKWFENVLAYQNARLPQAVFGRGSSFVE